MSRTTEQNTNPYVYSGTNYSMPTVLIVEDDIDNQLLLKIWLELWNYRVLEAGDGLEALNIAHKTCPDLILMDVKMPILDGLETTREIRRSRKIGGIPIIFLTGCAEAKYRSEAKDVGATDYLVKPLDFDCLESIIAEHINFSQTV